MNDTTLLASATRTATGQGARINTVNGYGKSGVNSRSAQVRVLLNISAASGTSPTLDVTIKGYIDGVLTVLGSFAQKTGTGQDSIVLESCPEDLQADYTIGAVATPSFTFSVSCTRA